MNCHNHHETSAIAVCRVCAVGLCDGCGIPMETGFVCLDICRSRAETIDKMLDVCRAEAIDKLLDAQPIGMTVEVGPFLMPALSIVIGGLLVGERVLFGAPSNTVKVIMGIVLLVAGFAYAFYVIYMKKITRVGRESRETAHPDNCLLRREAPPIKR